MNCLGNFNTDTWAHLPKVLTSLIHEKPRHGHFKAPQRILGFLVGSSVKNPSANAGDEGDVGLIPGLGRSPRGGNGNTLQYSCLKNSMDRGVWRAPVHGVTKSRSRLSTHTQNPNAQPVLRTTALMMMTACNVGMLSFI